MARMIPESPGDFHNSLGEKRIFRALRTLPDHIVVIHSFRWLHPGSPPALLRNLPAQGEGDFVLFDPTQGIMVVEVKGGEVWCEEGQWQQKNRRTGAVQPIYPEAQASSTMYRIREEAVEKVPDARNLLFCHAVWFPDGVVPGTQLPMNYHPHMTLDVEDISRPATAIQRAFDYWHSLHPGRRGMTTEAAKRLLRILAPTLSIVRSVRQTLDEREEVLVQLTREQARILDFLDEQPHAAILGAAGTGKTLLAIEKARRLATPSETVLFLCYNSALCEHLRRYHAQPNVQYHTFHGFAREIVGPDGPLDTAEQSLIEHLAEDRPVPYQHLVVDEGQDFDRDWLEYLRYRFRDAAFYVFCDRFQAIQGEKDTRWIAEIPCRLVLTRNCRNTDPVAKVAYRAGGLGITPTLGVAGPQPTLHRVSGGTEAVALVGSVIEAACARHKMQPHEIAVLTLQALNDGGWSRVERLGGQLIADKPQPNHVTVTTVRRFKGLEAALIFVVDVDFARGTDDEWRRLLYVACSRARHAVHIITQTHESDIRETLRSFAGTEKVRTSWRALARHLSVRLSKGNDDPFNEPGVG